jgi:hypothetical protein
MPDRSFVADSFRFQKKEFGPLFDYVNNTDHKENKQSSKTGDKEDRQPIHTASSRKLFNLLG